MTGELRNHRLRKTWDFQRILKGRQRIYNEYFVIFYQKNPMQGKPCRFGISTPQRIVKKAVFRNKCKRQIRDILLRLRRRKPEEWKTFEGWDFLIIIKEKFIDEIFNIKKDNLKNLLELFARKITNKHSVVGKTSSKKQERDSKHFEENKDRR